MKTDCANRFNGLLFFCCLHATVFSYAQNKEASDSIRHFAGSINITNNGISMIPTFSLGKPAAIFNMSLGNKKLSFEPEFRMSLEAKPWSVILWWRYKLANNNRFKINIGAHPAIIFKTISIVDNGVQKNIIQAQRFVAAEFSPNYLLSKNVSIGVYYLYGHGLESDAAQNTHFITFNSNISNIKLSNRLFMRFTPQVYYLKIDQSDGVYFTSSLAFANMRYPFSISGVFNKAIKTNIAASQSFVWNTTLSYSFMHNYLKR